MQQRIRLRSWLMDILTLMVQNSHTIVLHHFTKGHIIAEIPSVTFVGAFVNIKLNIKGMQNFIFLRNLQKSISIGNEVKLGEIFSQSQKLKPTKVSLRPIKVKQIQCE